MGEFETPIPIELERVESEADAERLSFRGSPTILIDGEDPFADETTPVGLTCRLYNTEAGVEGSPSFAQLRAAVSGEASEGREEHGDAAAMNLEEVATGLATTLRRNPAGEPIGVLGPALLRLLARGTPVAPSEIADSTCVPLDEVMTRLDSFPDAETDAEGNLVGMGLTQRPTKHRFQTQERQLYTWCALDTLMYPPLLGIAAQVESPCQATGEPVRVVVGPEGIRHVDPASAVVSIVMPEDSCDLRDGFCNEVHFFRSPEAAEEWLAAHPGGAVMSVVDAFEVGRMLNDATYGCC